MVGEIHGGPIEDTGVCPDVSRGVGEKMREEECFEGGIARMQGWESAKNQGRVGEAYGVTLSVKEGIYAC
jgi:hypothetical protein